MVHTAYMDVSGWALGAYIAYGLHGCGLGRKKSAGPRYYWRLRSDGVLNTVLMIEVGMAAVSTSMWEGLEIHRGRW